MLTAECSSLPKYLNFERVIGIREAAQITLKAASLIEGNVIRNTSPELSTMHDRTNSLKDHRSLSIEEQLKEASRDATGRIRRYLDLAEKLFKGDEEPTAEAA